MPQYIFSNFSTAEKIKCCKELMQSLFEKKQKVYLSELEYYLTTESIKFESRIKNQKGQCLFFQAPPPCIEMQPMLNTSTITNETSSKDVLGINEYSEGLLIQLIGKLKAQQFKRMSTAMEATTQLKHGKMGITKALFEKLGAEVNEVLEKEILEENCKKAEEVLQNTETLYKGVITPQKIAAYREFASTIKSNRSSKSLENLGKTMLVIAGIALAMTLLVAFNVIAASGLLVIAGLTTAFFTGSIGSVLLIDSEPQGLGKAVNDIADNAESIHMLRGMLGSR